MRYVAGNFIPKAVMVQEVFPTNSICSYSPPLSLTYVPDTLLQDANKIVAKRIISILFITELIILRQKLDFSQTMQKVVTTKSPWTVARDFLLFILEDVTTRLDSWFAILW